MRDLVPAFFVFIQPGSFVTKRNRVAPERKVSNPYLLSPASDSPFEKGGIIAPPENFAL